MLCLHDSIRHDDPTVQCLLRAVEHAHSLTALILAAWQVARVLTVHLVEAVLAERARRPLSWPPCPACGASLRSKGFAARQVTSLFGPIQWRRRVGRCPRGCVIPQVAPLDEALGVQPHQRTSGELQSLGCALAVFMPFATAARLLGWYSGSTVSPRAVWCWVQAAGQRAMEQLHEQLQALARCTGTPATDPVTGLPCPGTLAVSVEPYRAAYFLINGRSMPDNMDPDYAPNYPSQPYNANPHMHPGDLVLIRTIGQGHLQHPFHEHANHVRILARDGGLILSQNDANATATNPPRLAGRMEFDTDTTPGQAFDGIFYWSGKGLGWDIYAHTFPTVNAVIATAHEVGHTVTIATGLPLPPTVAVGQSVTVAGLAAGYDGTFTIQSLSAGTNCSTAASPGICVLTYTDSHTGLLPSTNTLTASITITESTPTTPDPHPCHPDANGYYTTNSIPAAPLTAPNYYEWCADHNHPLETNPVGQVGGGGPMTLPDPLIMTNGLWYNGTPYLGRDAVVSSRGATPLPPASTTMNPLEESGIAFMWHSHNEREITTNDVFPGGMLMMMLVDPPTFFIDETL